MLRKVPPIDHIVHLDLVLMHCKIDRACWVSIQSRLVTKGYAKPYVTHFLHIYNTYIYVNIYIYLHVSIHMCIDM